MCGGVDLGYRWVDRLLLLPARAVVVTRSIVLWTLLRRLLRPCRSQLLTVSVWLVFICRSVSMPGLWRWSVLVCGILLLHRVFGLTLAVLDLLEHVVHCSFHLLGRK